MNSALKSAAAPAEHLAIRILTPNDWEEYRSLRAKILEMGDGKYFADSYTRESALTSVQQWRDWCTETPEHCIFGTFVNGELVGVVMVTQLGPFADRTAEWEASWLHPRYRKTGIMRVIYNRVQDWTKEQGYEFVRVFIREDNTQWQAVRRKMGFYGIGKKRALTWADGSIADAYIFELGLVDAFSLDQSGDTERRLVRSLAS